jgi:hypothetical protein
MGMSLRDIYRKHPAIISVLVLWTILILITVSYMQWETIFGSPPPIDEDRFAKIIGAAFVGALVGPYFMKRG